MTQFRHNILMALDDVGEAIRKSRLWFYLGWLNIQQRYRGSFLGPLWITLSMAIFIAVLGVVYSRLFKLESAQYIPFLTVGLLCWTYISTSLSEACNIFCESQNFIQNTKLPYSMHVFNMVWRNTIIFFHNMIVYVLVMAYYKVPVNWHTLLFIPGFLLVTAALIGAIVIVSIISTRFRDIPPVINSLIMVTFFVSPITWLPKLVGTDSLIIQLNPVTYLLDVIRSPLLGRLPNASSWVIVAGLALVSLILALLVFARGRRNIPFWV